MVTPANLSGGELLGIAIRFRNARARILPAAPGAAQTGKGT